MTITVVDVQSHFDSGSPNTVGKPIGTADGDLMLLSISWLSSVGFPAPPPGWKIIPNAFVTGSNNIQVYWKIAFSEPSSYDILTPNSSNTVSIITLRTDNVLANVQVETAANQTNTSSTNRIFPSVTSGGADRYLVCVGTLGSGQNSTPDAAMTERVDLGSSARQYMMTEAIGAAGATGTRTATGTATTSKTVSILVFEGAIETPTPEVRLVQQQTWAEFSGNPGVAVSQIGGYVEVGGQLIHVSQAGVYVEVAQDELRVSQMGVYIEIEEVGRMATQSISARGARGTHVRLPDEVTGYAFDPEHSWWEIVVPEETINYIHNPSFEVGNEGYDEENFTETRLATLPIGATGGRYAIRLVRIFSNQEAYYQYDHVINLTDRGVVVFPGYWSFSCDIYAQAGATFRLRIRNDNPATVANRKFVHAQTGWHRYSLTWAEVSSGNRYPEIHVEADFYLGSSETIYTDRWQVENKRYPTTYADGDMLGWNDTYPTQSYFWKGVRHASHSVRRHITGSGGRPVSFTEFKFLTKGIVGLGMAPVDLLSITLSDGDEIPTGIRTLPRDFTITGVVMGCSYTDLWAKRDQLIQLIRPNNTPGHEHIILRYQPTDGVGRFIGMPLDIVCAYKTGLEGNLTNLYQETMGIQFRASQPYPSETMDSADSLQVQQTLFGNRIVYRDHLYSYRNLGIGVSEASGGYNVGGWRRNGSPIIAGLFTAISGFAEDNIAWYDFDGEEWLQMASDSGFNAAIYALETSRYLDGVLGVGGAFTTLGVDTVNHFALKNSESELSTWSQAGLNGLNGNVRSISRTPDGMWYVAGEFTAEGDGSNTGLKRVAQYDPDLETYADLDEGVNGTIVHNMVIPGDDYLYVVGDFTVAGGVGTSVNSQGVARWNLRTLAWESMNGGVNNTVHQIFFASDGTPYIIGDFLQDVGATYDLRYFARWNGSAWEEPFALSAYTALPENVRVAIDHLGVFWFYHKLSGTFSNVPAIGTTTLFGWKDGVFYPSFIQHVAAGGSAAIDVLEFDKDGKMILATNLPSVSNEIHTPYMNEITYHGGADAYPILAITGVCSPVHVHNVTSQASIYFRSTLEVASEEEMRVSLTGWKRKVYSDMRPNLMRHVYLAPTSFVGFRLRPGVNRISFFARDVSGGAAYMVWRNRYWSIDAAPEL